MKSKQTKKWNGDLVNFRGCDLISAVTFEMSVTIIHLISNALSNCWQFNNFFLHRWRFRGEGFKEYQNSRHEFLKCKANKNYILTSSISKKLKLSSPMPKLYSSGPRSGTSCARGEPSHFAGLSHLVALHKNNTRRVRQLGDFSLVALALQPWFTNSCLTLSISVGITNEKTRSH